jgi:hypothetical protein
LFDIPIVWLLKLTGNGPRAKKLKTVPLVYPTFNIPKVYINFGIPLEPTKCYANNEKERVTAIRDLCLGAILQDQADLKEFQRMDPNRYRFNLLQFLRIK